MKKFFNDIRTDETGASAAEYALILVVVGIGLVVAATALEGAISNAMNGTATIINNNTTTTGG